MAHLFTLTWWRYVLDDSRADKAYGPDVPIRIYAVMPRWLYALLGYWTRFVCRWKGHPAGVWFYSGGTEPDMRCKGCGEDIG